MGAGRACTGCRRGRRVKGQAAAIVAERPFGPVEELEGRLATLLRTGSIRSKSAGLVQPRMCGEISLAGHLQ